MTHIFQPVHALHCEHQGVLSAHSRARNRCWDWRRIDIRTGIVNSSASLEKAALACYGHSALRSEKHLVLSFFFHFLNVPAGTSVGGLVYPIMLNQLIHGSVGFKWGVRAAAFLTLGMLAIANCCMKPISRFLPPRSAGGGHTLKTLRKVVVDAPYMLTISGQVNVKIYEHISSNDNISSAPRLCYGDSSSPVSIV